VLSGTSNFYSLDAVVVCDKYQFMLVCVMHGVLKFYIFNLLSIISVCYGAASYNKLTNATCSVVD